MAERVIVEKRYPGERLDIREFIRPDTLMVQELVSRLPPDPTAHYRWVVEQIAYPVGGDEVLDLHQECRWVTRAGRWRTCQLTDEFWSFPSETLADRVGDCDDKSILLVSMLRHLYPPQAVWATVGYWQGFGHMWVTVWTGQGWAVYETTLDRPDPRMPVPEASPYEPLLRFNDVEAAWMARGPLPPRVRDPEKTSHLQAAYTGIYW